MTLAELLHRGRVVEQFRQHVLVEDAGRGLGGEVGEAHVPVVDVGIEQSADSEMFVAGVHLGEHAFAGQQVQAVEQGRGGEHHLAHPVEGGPQ